MHMTHTLHTCIALAMALLGMAPAQAQPAPQKAAEGTFYLLNVGQQKYLGTGTDINDKPMLMLSATAVPVTLKACTGTAAKGRAARYTLLVDGKELGADVFGSPTLDGTAANLQWSFFNQGAADAPVYALGNMQREANAYAMLYYSNPAFGGEKVTAGYIWPSAMTGSGQWVLVSEADYANVSVVMDENADTYTCPAYVDDSHPATVLLRRKFTLNSWNTVCLPFSLTKAQLDEAFSQSADNGYRLARFNRFSNGVMHFDEVSEVFRGTPYLLFPTKVSADNEYTFTGVTAFASNAVTVSIDGCQYIPSFVRTTAPQGSYALSGNQLYHLTSDKAMKGFRGYFLAPAQQKLATWRLDGPATGIAGTEGGTPSAPGNVYSLDGRRVRPADATLHGLPNGIYVTKGKKLLKVKR